MERARSLRLAALVATAVGAVAVFGTAAQAAPSLNRPADPVVLSGADLDSLLGAKPERIVAFKRKRRGWRQVPVQVDERRTVDLGDVYDGTREGIEIEAYADPSTLTGADPDPMLDSDDEVATMARFAGRRAGRDRRGRIVRPDGTRRRGVTRIRIEDPRSSARGWIYLFRGKPRLDPAAGRDLVGYDFRLLGGSYPEDFDFRDGPNAERSNVSTRHYRLRFTDRWINDLLEIRAGGATRADLLDRRKVQFAPGACGRTTDSFTAAEGAFVSNIDGPIRGIRSYVGANSGPMTQREHIFYDRREEATTLLRVHAIPGVMDFLDYSPTPETMVYRSDAFRGGVPIDGSPDALPEAAPLWEQISGPHGSLTHVWRLDTTVEGLALSSYRLDQSAPNDGDEVQCTGDELAWGASGTRIDGGIPNTDPLRGEQPERLTSTRTIFYDGPGSPRRAAVKRAAWTQKPLRTTARAVATRPRG